MFWFLILFLLLTGAAILAVLLQHNFITEFAPSLIVVEQLEGRALDLHLACAREVELQQRLMQGDPDGGLKSALIYQAEEVARCKRVFWRGAKLARQMRVIDKVTSYTSFLPKHKDAA